MHKKIHYFTFGLDLGVKVTRNIAQYPLLFVTYLGIKFEVARSDSLGGDTLTRNVTDARTHRRTDGHTDRWTTDRLWYEINIPYFLQKKSGYNKFNFWSVHGIMNTSALLQLA